MIAIPSPAVASSSIQRSEVDGTTVLEVAAPRIKFVLIAGSIWLVAWCSGLYGVLFALGLGHRGYAFLDILLLVWLAFWVISGLAVLGIVLWGFFGHERLTIGPDTLTLQRLVFGLGRTRTLPTREVSNVRYRPVRTDFFGAKSKWSMLGLGAGKVRFTHGGKGYSFGLGLPDGAAEALAAELQGRFGG